MMIDDDNDGQMIFGDLGGLKLPDICLTDEEKTRKNLTQETCPDRGSNPGPLRDRRACYHLTLSGGLSPIKEIYIMTVFCPGAGLSMQEHEPRLQSFQRQVFQRNSATKAAVLPGIE